MQAEGRVHHLFLFKMEQVLQSVWFQVGSDFNTNFIGRMITKIVCKPNSADHMRRCGKGLYQHARTRIATSQLDHYQLKNCTKCSFYIPFFPDIRNSMVTIHPSLIHKITRYQHTSTTKSSMAVNSNLQWYTNNQVGLNSYVSQPTLTCNLINLYSREFQVLSTDTQLINEYFANQNRCKYHQFIHSVYTTRMLQPIWLDNTQNTWK